MPRIEIRNWSRFQHYRHRSPPWIKLHRGLLDNRDWTELPPAAAKLLVGLWLIASDHDGSFDGSLEDLRWRMRLEEDVPTMVMRLNDLERHGFISLADCQHVASTELDRVEESRVEERRDEVPNGTSCQVSVEPGVAIVSHSGNGTRTGIPQRSGTRLNEIQQHLAEVLAEVSEERLGHLKADEMRRVQAELVFAYWAHRTGHQRALLDQKREVRLIQCLKRNDGDVHQLLYAIDGWFKDPVFKRMADEGRKLDQIQNIFTDQERIERLAEHCKGYEAREPHPMAVKYLGAVTP